MTNCSAAREDLLTALSEPIETENVDAIHPALIRKNSNLCLCSSTAQYSLFFIVQEAWINQGGLLHRLIESQASGQAYQDPSTISLANFQSISEDSKSCQSTAVLLQTGSISEKKDSIDRADVEKLAKSLLEFEKPIF